MSRSRTSRAGRCSSPIRIVGHQNGTFGTSGGMIVHRSRASSESIEPSSAHRSCGPIECLSRLGSRAGRSGGSWRVSGDGAMLDISRAPAVPSADTSWRSDVLLARLRSALALVSDPDKAPAMRAYMRSAMPYLGTAMPSVRTICRAVFAEIEYADQETWAADVRVIWRSARFREERYAAIELTGIPAAARFQNPKAFDLYDELIVTGAWWDFIDPLASQRLWTILREHRAPARREMLSWSKSPDMWKRRSSIICQLPCQAEHRPRSALRVHRAVHRFEGVLPAQGHRMGAAAVRPDGPRRGPEVRPFESKPAQRAQPARSLEASLVAPARKVPFR